MEIQQQMQQKSKQKQKDHTISKLQRVLLSHSLQGLVYQKRQRKQAINHYVQSFPQKKIPQKYPKPAITRNKKQITEDKKMNKFHQQSQHLQNHLQSIKQQVKKQDNLSSIPGDQQKKQLPRKRGRPRKITVQSQVKDQKENQQGVNKSKLSIISQNVGKESDQQNQNNLFQKKKKKKQSSHSDKQDGKQKKKKKKKKKKKLKVDHHQKNIQQVKNINNDDQKQNEQISQNTKNKLQNSQKLLKDPTQQHPQQKQQQQLPQHPQKQLSKQSQKQQLKQKQQNQQQQHQSSQSSQELSQQQQQQQQQSSSSQSSSSSSSSSESSSSSQSDSSDEQQQNQGSTRRVGRKAGRADQIDNNQIQDDEQRGSDQFRRRKLRERKTKEQAIKKRMFEGFSDSEDGQYYQCRRRKGVSGQQKQYQINRIFRRNQKPLLPNVKLQVDIMKFSFQNFQQKLSYFDMIHCSLPIDMLIKLSNISSIIPKGFIFIWVQKGEIQIGYHWLNRIGFDVIDQIIWVKTNHNSKELVCDQNTQDQLFPNCRSVCLVGYKCSTTQRTQYRTKISNNIIFSPEKPASIENPDEIYQIGDLMMPGARKLEIGIKEFGGWFTLKHKQESFARCHQCLRKDRRMLLYTENKEIKCEYCLIYNLKQQKQLQQQSSAVDEQSKKSQQILLYQKLINLPHTYKIQVINKRFAQSLGCKCSQCHQSAPQLMEIVIENSEEEDGIGEYQNHVNANSKKQTNLLCKKCLVVPEQTSLIKVYNLKQIYFPSKFVKCSKCHKNQLQKYYFQCFTCKNQHVLCSQCLLSIPSEEEPSNKNHQWKLIILNDFPQTRAVCCFICGQQCMIPYWGCQTCQNWYWCGTCDRSQKPKIHQHQHHCHYSREHNLHLIM